MDLKDSKTIANLIVAFNCESQVNRRYVYFASKAELDGYTEIASVFRSTADGETGHALGHLEFIEAVGDPVTKQPISTVEQCLVAAISCETHEYSEVYPGMAKVARDEGFFEIADWFETLAKAERSHAQRFQKLLDNLQKSR